MDDKTNPETDTPVIGLPEPNPPEGGPGADPGSPEPADLVPGLGGTSETKPESTGDDG